MQTAILNTLQAGVVTHCLAETQEYGYQLGGILPAESIVALYGEVGTGKTSFTRGLAKAFKVADTLTSPTFNYYLIYEGGRRLIHVDGYRLRTPAQFADFGIEEWMVPPFSLVIEWPEKLGTYLPDSAWKLYFSHVSETERKLQLQLPIAIRGPVKSKKHTQSSDREV